MKQSGIDWIGEIPDGWEITKAKTILRNKSIKNHPNAEVLSLYRDYGVVPKKSRDDNHNVTSEDTASYKYVRKGELVLNKMKTRQGSLAVSEYEGIVSPAYYVCEFRNDNIEKKYIHYLLRNKMYAQEFERLSTGLRVGQWDLNIDDFLNTLIILPPLAEQQKIASYLDKKISQIDAIITEAKQSIEEYKAWKQSVIFEAVTGKNKQTDLFASDDAHSNNVKGVSPEQIRLLKMKDSGIEWIGEIPEGWEVKRFKFIATSLEKGAGITKEEVFEDGDTPCVRYGEIYSKYNHSFTNCISKTFSSKLPVQKYFTNGDILFVGTGELVEEIGKCIAYLGNGICLAGGDIIVAKHKQNPSFLSYAMNSSYAQNQKSRNKAKLKVVHISATEIGDVLILLPSLSEQEAIAKMLDSKCAQIDSLIAEKESLIADLAEYKKSLIFEVVTGKRSV